MSPLENLKAARAWLGEGEHRWCKGAFGYDAHGLSLFYSDVIGGRAVRCCAIGAAISVSGTEGKANAAIYALARALTNGSLSVQNYNDDLATTYADILALYDRAIELAERSEGKS